MDNKADAVTRGKAYLEQSGVKGMRWGVRRSRAERKAGRAQAKADEKQAHEDHKLAQHLQSKKVKHLSNAELQFLNKRLELENNNRRLTGTKTKSQKRQEQVKTALAVYKISSKVVKSKSGQEAVKKALAKATSKTGQKILTKMIV